MSSVSGVGGSSASNAWSTMAAQRGNMQEKLFAKVDSDGNGGVDTKELQAVMDTVAKKTGTTNSSSAQDLLAKADTNGDGTLGSDELAAAMKSILPAPSTLQFAQSRSDSSGSAAASGSVSGATGQAGDDLFGKVDTDGSGSLSASEFQALMDKMGGDGAASGSSGTSGTSSSAASDAFTKLDSNGDGSLSQAEFDAGRPQGGPGRSGGADGASAQGGTQAAGGMPPPHGGPPPGGGGGGGGGGGASSASSSTYYDPLDTNQDGVVSPAERAAGAAAADLVQALIGTADTNGDKTVSKDEATAFADKLTAALTGSTTTTSGTGSDTGGASSSSASAGSSSTNTQQVDLAKVLAQLFQKQYDQVASGQSSSTGTLLSTVA